LKKIIKRKGKGNNIAEIGIKICDFDKQGKGYGKKLLRMFIKYLFEELT
jgi:RimJ/RimL family protein N-acetyltransferase